MQCHSSPALNLNISICFHSLCEILQKVTVRELFHLLSGKIVVVALYMLVKSEVEASVLN